MSVDAGYGLLCHSMYRMVARFFATCVVYVAECFSLKWGVMGSATVCRLDAFHGQLHGGFALYINSSACQF
jgi:hypothetical protein